MAKYFFTVHHEGSAADLVGEELPSDEAAWHEADVSRVRGCGKCGRT